MLSKYLCCLTRKAYIIAVMLINGLFAGCASQENENNMFGFGKKSETYEVNNSEVNMGENDAPSVNEGINKENKQNFAKHFPRSGGRVSKSLKGLFALLGIGAMAATIALSVLYTESNNQIAVLNSETARLNEETDYLFEENSNLKKKIDEYYLERIDFANYLSQVESEKLILQNQLSGATSLVSLACNSLYDECESCREENNSIQCSRCSTGFFLNYYGNTASCMSCMEMACLTCSSTLENQTPVCHSCPSGRYLSGGSCTACTNISNCQIGQSTCTNENDSVCTRCMGRFFVYEGSCRECIFDPNCSGPVVCTSTSPEPICNRCIAGYYSNSRGVCTECTPVPNCMVPEICTSALDSICNTCNFGYYSNRGVCNQCNPAPNCQPGSSTCMTASDSVCGGALCNPGYYADMQICNACVPNCDQCFNNTSCNSCFPGFSYNVVTNQCECIGEGC